MAKKKFYMVIDTETCGDYVFDIGYRVIDRAGNCYANGSYVVAEFIENPATLNMFNDRFTRDKIGKYYFDLWADNGGFNVLDFYSIMCEVNEVRNDFNAIVCAYNIAFDLLHLDKTADYFGYDNFFNSDIQTLDIWHMAMCVLGTNNYIRFCIANDFLTNGGNIATGAEIMYRYICNDVEFKEAHTAHEDCIIECKIMHKCFSRKKHFETSTVGMCIHNKEWQRIQTKYKELD